MSAIQPLRHSEPRYVNTIFGVAKIEGPFVDDYTTLNWSYESHRDGEIARYKAAGYELYVLDMDGDMTVWEVRQGKKVLEKGSDHGSRPDHFIVGLVMAERALRDIVLTRSRTLRGRAFDRREAGARA